MIFSLKDLTVELAKTPLGLDEPAPRFAWKMESGGAARQKSYDISVSCEAGEIFWQSGIIESADSAWIEYAGKPLLPSTRYVWAVTVTDAEGDTASESSYFETGLMDKTLAAWSGAEWIGADENMLEARAKPLFAVTTKFTLGTAKSAGLVFGKNDPRLLDATKNDFLISGENYIKYAITSAGTLDIYRVGYSPDDRAGAPFASIPLVNFDTDEPITFDKSVPHTLRVEVVGNGAYAYLDEIRIDAEKRPMPNFGAFAPPKADSNSTEPPRFRVVPRQLNPTGDNDLTTYPQLCDVGIFAEGMAEFESLIVNDIRPPRAEIFSLTVKTAKETLFAEFLENGELSAKGGKLIVTDKMVTANPSHTSTPMLRRTLNIKSELKRARLYVASRGIYELYTNGKRVGNKWFEPGAAQYDAHMPYQTYDLTAELSSGENALGFMLASGWWNESQTFSLPNYNYWGDRQSVMAKLVLEYADGGAETVITDKNWKYYGDGPITFAGFFYGESFDANRTGLIDAFTAVNFDDSAWRSAVVVPLTDFSEIAPAAGGFMSWPVPSNGTLEFIGYCGEPIRHIETLAAVGMTEPRPGVYVYDMGQNMVGVPRLKLRGKAGTEAVLRYAEILYPPLAEYGDLCGMLLTENLRDALNIDRYRFASDKIETYSPRFTFHGYRYIEISGVSEAPALGDVEGLVLSSINELTGEFECSDPMVNKLYSNIRWSQYANFISIPTDCPQRNERMGWAGDAQVFARTAGYNADVYMFLRRWLLWMRDCQLSDGRFPDIAPVGGGFGGIAWGSAGVIVAYELWRQYGDTRVIAEHYDAMLRYMDFLDKKAIEQEQGLGKMSNIGPLGDWLAFDMTTDSPLLWNAIHYHDANILSAMAAAIGKTADAAKFAALALEIKRVWNETFVDPETGKTRRINGEINDTQATYSTPLGYGVFNDAKQAVENLTRKIAESGNTATTGFIGSASLCPALCDGGYTGEAYALLRQTNYPGWLYSVTQGATTIWERWNSFTVENGFGGNNGMNSFNHYSFGAVGAWMYGYTLGIIPNGENGYKTFTFRPFIGGFSYAKGHYDSVYGRIESEWRINGGMVEIRLVVPANTTATVFLPDGTAPFEVGGGTHSFSVKL